MQRVDAPLQLAPVLGSPFGFRTRVGGKKADEHAASSDEFAISLAQPVVRGTRTIPYPKSDAAQNLDIADGANLVGRASACRTRPRLASSFPAFS